MPSALGMQPERGSIPGNSISRGGQNVQTYVGLGKDFKARYSKHKSSMENPSPEKYTTLFTYFLSQKSAGLGSKLSWKFLQTNLETQCNGLRLKNWNKMLHMTWPYIKDNTQVC